MSMPILRNITHSCVDNAAKISYKVRNDMWVTLVLPQGLTQGTKL